MHTHGIGRPNNNSGCTRHAVPWLTAAARDALTFAADPSLPSLRVRSSRLLCALFLCSACGELHALGLTLDGRVLSIPCPEVVSPGYEKLVEGEGMPLSKTPAKHGMLKIHFKLNFPKYLAQNVKDSLRPLLTPPVSEPSVKVNPAK